jgi:hypothetical protein
LITPLRKYKPDGELYARRPIIQAKIAKLALLTPNELISRCEISYKNDPGYVPSECLMYFLRQCRSNRADIHFQKLYELLTKRVLCRLPAENSNKESLANINIREKVYGNFAKLLASDRKVYSDKLDYYEVNFNHALKFQHLDALKQERRSKNYSANLCEEKTGELTVEVEQAAGSFNTPDVYRIDLDEAINTLEPLEREIIRMYIEGIPFDSKDPGKSTMTKKLGICDKTIRTRFKKAINSLSIALNGGNQI